jgi:peptidyl-tRNA hydrolase, PTH2 family
MSVKQVIVVRTDLNMRKGKIGAQCAHASFQACLSAGSLTASSITIRLTRELEEWFSSGTTKIVLGVESEEDLIKVVEMARAKRIPHALITDAGRTEFSGVPTKTAAAIGPADSNLIDTITGPDGAVKTRLI